MAGREYRGSDNQGVSREVFSSQQAVKQEQQAAQTPRSYGEEYGGKLDLQPSRHPNAFSHDSGYHDAAHEHISSLRSRLDALVTSKTLRGITPKVKAHLDAAEDQTNRSFAAHKAGTADGASALHTADSAYRAAHQHITDAHRTLVEGLGPMSKMAQKIGNDKHWTDTMLGDSQRQGLVSGYTQHLKGAAEKSRLTVPNGVLADKPINTNSLAPMSAAGNKVAETRGFAKRPVAPEVKAQLAVNKMTTRASTGGTTPTLEQVERTRASVMEGGVAGKAKTSKNSYAGVGITGFNDVANSSKLHYEYNNPGKSWHASSASKDPIGYGIANKVGVPSQSNVIAHRLRLMGEEGEGRRAAGGQKGLADQAANIAREAYEEKPGKPTGKRTGEFGTGSAK